MASATITGPAMPHESKRPLSEEELGKMHAYWRAQHKAVPSIEDRTTPFGTKIKGILRQIVFSSGALCRRASDIKRGNVIKCF